MDSQASTNGEEPKATNGMTAAEKLRQRHEAEATHYPMVEDVVDEEDLAHPPPSMLVYPDSSSGLAATAEAVPKPARAVEKQKAQNGQGPASMSTNSENRPPLNTQSEELFPALGSGPRAPVPSATVAWGSNKPNSVHNGPNGVNGSGHIPSVTSSRASTPTSGILTPVSLNAPSTQSRNLSFPQKMSMPGKHIERIQFAQSQIQPRGKLKKPLHDTVRDFNRRSKATIEMKTGANGAILFEGRGPVDATRQALKDLAREVGSEQHVTIPIPLSVRRHVVGTKGAIIQRIEAHTGARIQLPKTDVTTMIGTSEDDDSQTIDISIKGDAVAAEMARREIEAIIAERTSTVKLRLKNIPAEYFPHIAGPHDARTKDLGDGQALRIDIPHYHTWSDQAPPQAPPAGSLPRFVPSVSHQIVITGERVAAHEAKAEIESQVAVLQKELCLSQIQIDRGRHQFILENEDSFHDFLQKTGCAIILPPSTDESEMLTVTGPRERIDAGLDRVMELASAMQMSRVDIARQHGNAPLGPQTHARALTQYFQDRQTISQLETQHSARIVLPNDERGSPDWEIYCKEGRNGMRARQDILNLISAHPPHKIRHVEMDPFFHQHVHQHGAKKLRDEFGVHLLSPQQAQPARHMIIVYEGPQSSDTGRFEPPRQAPSPQQLAKFDESLQQAQHCMLELISGQQNIGTANISVPPRYHEKVRRFVRQEQEDLPFHRVPVRIHIDSASLSDEDLPKQYEHSIIPANGHDHGVLQGPNDVLADFVAKIDAFIKTEERDELERGHVTTFDFPQKHMNRLIGKGGENINKFRKEFDIDIQTKDERVDIIGPKAKAELAKIKILNLAKQLDDEATHVLKISPKYHREIIGARGSQVNRLQDRYNVYIQFPRSIQRGDDRSVTEEVSEISAPRNQRSNHGPDEVIVKGPRKGADGAREELLALLQWTIENSHEAVVSVAQKQLPALIGQGGSAMEAIRLESGAQIDIPSKESVDSAGRVQIRLKGNKKQVEEAKKVLEGKAKEYDNVIVRNIHVDKKHHNILIGSGGSNLRNIFVAAGGPDDGREVARAIRVPRQDSEDSTVRVEGKKELVDRIAVSIEAFASQKEGQITESIEVAPEKHRLLIGRAGESKKALENRFKVDMIVPRISEEGLARSRIKVSGQPVDVAKAKAHILDIIQDFPEETIQIPCKYHHTIADNGQFFRRLRNDHKIKVHHSGQTPPPKLTTTSAPQSNGSISMPLITDDPASNSTHSFSIIHNCPASTEEGTIPWVLNGSPESIAGARTALEKALKNAEAQQSQATGYLVLPDPRNHRFVIGHGGSTISDIRKQTGCRINVPRDQKEGSAIEIVGSTEGVEQARDMIIDVVRNGGRKM